MNQIDFSTKIGEYFCHFKANFLKGCVDKFGIEPYLHILHSIEM
jgi:hypothetical protein